MIDEKLDALFKAIYKKTMDGMVDWKESAAKGAFVATLGQFSLRIDTDSRDNVILEVFDDERNTIATYREQNLLQKHDDSARELRTLYTSAHNTALRVDDKVDALLQMLG